MRLAGEQVRCFDLPAGERGYFDRAGHSKLSADIIARRINEGLHEHHGAGLKAWINWLTKQDEARLAKRLSARIDRFVETVSASGPLSALETRAARKFGLMYAALAMGGKAGIVGISSRKALKSCRKAFHTAMAAAVAADPEKALNALKSALNAKHALVKTFQGAKAVQRHIRKHPDWLAVDTKRNGKRVIGLYPPSLRKVLGPHAAEVAIAELQARGLLSQEKGTERWQKKLPGAMGKVRLLQLDLSCLADG